MNHIQAVKLSARCRWCVIRTTFNKALLRICGLCRALLKLERLERAEIPVRLFLVLWDAKTFIAVIGGITGWEILKHVS